MRRPPQINPADSFTLAAASTDRSLDTQQQPIPYIPLQKPKEKQCPMIDAVPTAELHIDRQKRRHELLDSPKVPSRKPIPKDVQFFMIVLLP
ncbi:MAG: hypothetical protein K2X81_16585 [Candidatus Obscuribacterales bacterium]|nr:hypothetical protein [Candidatus Obscuribacterales bacterium]